MVRAHRQAWCWQDEWYGLTIEDIRQLELETQLALAKKMGHYSQNEEGGTETNGSSVSQDQDPGPEAAGMTAEAEAGKLGDSLENRRELTKQWSTSSRSSNRSSKRGGEGHFLVFDRPVSVNVSVTSCAPRLQGARLTRASRSGGCRASPGTPRTARTTSSSTLTVKPAVQTLTLP